LRYVVEALAGGESLDKIDPKLFCTTETGQPVLVDLAAKKREIEILQKGLKNKRHVLVGHNLFTDLVFIYQAFIADLPDDVSIFEECIHRLFPYVIDTKYMATHASGSMGAGSSLKELCAGLKPQPLPIVVLDEKHIAYGGLDKDHEAGYDSRRP
jgi:poly(A)-specific ribonuclease